MNESIIERYNSVVEENDIVYCLGDCGLGGAGQEALNQLKNYIERLNGTIIIIQGNHCTDKRIEIYQQCKNVQQVEIAMTLKYRGYHFFLSHYPTLTANYDEKSLKQKMINLCGHVHTPDRFADFDKGLIYHCEVDAHDNKPVLLDDIIQEIKTKVRENNEKQP